ncbi:MAG: type II toxin-antitoxin system PemK/MazF family toxin [Acidobacteriaceae bacterium]
MNLLRGEVWWADLDPTRGSEIKKRRPCVIVSSDTLNRKRRTVVVVPLSTSPVVRPPLTIAVLAGGRPAVAVIDQIRATAKERFAKRTGALTSAEMEAIEEGIRQVLAMGR